MEGKFEKENCSLFLFYELDPSFNVLERKNDVSGVGSAPIFRRKIPVLLGPIEGANTSPWARYFHLKTCVEPARERSCIVLGN
jgi:hypothetical protein